MSKNNEARVKFFCWWSCFTNSKRKGVGKGSNFYSEVWVKFLDTPTRFNPYVCGYLRQQQQYERNISWTSKVPIPILVSLCKSSYGACALLRFHKKNREETQYTS